MDAEWLTAFFDYLWDIKMQVLSIEQIDEVSGALTTVEGAGLALAGLGLVAGLVAAGPALVGAGAVGYAFGTGSAAVGGMIAGWGFSAFF